MLRNSLNKFVNFVINLLEEFFAAKKFVYETQPKKMDIRHLISDHLLCPGDIVGEFFLLQFLGELPEGVSDVLGAGTEPLQRLGKKNEGYREDFYQSRVVFFVRIRRFSLTSDSIDQY